MFAFNITNSWQEALIALLDYKIMHRLLWSFKRYYRFLPRTLTIRQLFLTRNHPKYLEQKIVYLNCEGVFKKEIL